LTIIHVCFQVYGDGLITLGKNTFFHAVLLRHRKFPFPPSTPSIAVFYAPIEVKNSSVLQGNQGSSKLGPPVTLGLVLM